MRRDLIDGAVVVEAVETCVACPWQVEGALSTGERFYFRYRHGRATFGIGTTDDDAVTDPQRSLIEHGEPLQGCLDSPEEERELFTRALVERLGSRLMITGRPSR